jgi:hypothetical protein
VHPVHDLIVQARSKVLIINLLMEQKEEKKNESNPTEYWREGLQIDSHERERW